MVFAPHEQAVALLTGHERFVRLVIERETPVVPQNSSKCRSNFFLCTFESLTYLLYYFRLPNIQKICHR